MEEIQWGQVALRKVALQNYTYMLVAGGWGQGRGEVRAYRRWKAGATSKAHMKLNRKEDRNVRIKNNGKRTSESHLCFDAFNKFCTFSYGGGH